MFITVFLDPEGAVRIDGNTFVKISLLCTKIPQDPGGLAHIVAALSLVPFVFVQLRDSGARDDDIIVIKTIDRGARTVDQNVRVQHVGFFHMFPLMV